jgi:hypothetical protein
MNPAENLAILQAKVKAAQEEFDLAVRFHEAWKPAVYDHDLRERMGVSYATNTFDVIKLALRRETILALTRLWDRDYRSVGMERVAESLNESSFVDILAQNRKAYDSFPESRELIRDSINEKVAAALNLIAKYSEGGSHHRILKSLRTIRNERLAHRQTTATAATGPDATDDDIEYFYQDLSKLIGFLSSLLHAEALDPQDFAGVYRYYGKFFWASVRGERTKGHPNFNHH